MKYDKQHAIESLWNIVKDEEEDIKARRSAVSTLFKYDDKEKVIATIEQMYEESVGITKVQMAQLIIKIDELSSNNNKFFELEI